MKLPSFKLPPNSLFAVLLRSRWWISLLIALFITLVAFAVLPLDYAPAAAMGALPFWAIGLVALVRQWRLPSGKQRAALREQLQAMTVRDLQRRLELAYAADGYQVQAGGTQSGCDLRLQRQDTVTLLSCRRFKASNLGVEPLRELTLAMQREPAQQGVMVALGTATEQAQRWAADHGVQILDADALLDWLRRQQQL